MAESRVTTAVAEVLNTGGEPHARVTTVVAEVLNTGGVPHARVTGLVAEVLHSLEELTAERARLESIVAALPESGVDIAALEVVPATAESAELRPLIEELVDNLERTSGGDDDVTDLQAVGQEHVALLAIGVVEQGDARRAVGVVLDRRQPRGHAELVALEVDPSVRALLAAAAMAHGQAALAVAPADALRGLEQRPVRLFHDWLVEAGL